MIKVRNEQDQVTVAKVFRAGQDHIFRFWDELTEAQRRTLLDQLATLDLQLLDQLCKLIERPVTTQALSPPTSVISLEHQRLDCARAKAAGEDLLRASRIAGVCVAGGQGTRLGFDGPKGCFPIGPVSDRCLFKMVCEQVLATTRSYRSSFPLYIMTSTTNHAATQKFLEQAQWFGLSPTEVQLFVQRELPAVDAHGKLLLAEPWSLATSPDGHGGVLRAMAQSGVLDDMARRGIDYVSYWQIDNPLVPIADPLFLGYAELQQAEAAAKVTDKARPDERVGIWARSGEHLSVVEYSELTEQQANERTEDDKLRYRAANLAIHLFRRLWLAELATTAKLPFHTAHRRMACIDRKGRVEETPCIKFETFVFDLFRYTDKTLLLEVAREDQFAPIKNATGPDSPKTSRQLLSNRYGSWLEQHGVEVPRSVDGDVEVALEISPLVALAASDLKGKVEPTTIDAAWRL